MIRPRKMKYIQLTVYRNDMNQLLEYLGKHGSMHFPETENNKNIPEEKEILQIIDSLRSAAEYVGIELADNIKENDTIPNDNDRAITGKYCCEIEAIKENEIQINVKKQKINETINEADAFLALNAPFKDLEQLSYLTLRIGRLDSKGRAALQANLKERVNVIPLGNDDRVIVASSRKGRFAMDSQLKSSSFEPIKIPEGYKGIPPEMIAGLKEQLNAVLDELEKIKAEKEKLKGELTEEFRRLYSSWQIALAIERIKARFIVSENVYLLSGWIPLDIARETVKDLLRLCGGRIAIRTFNPEEIPEIKNGKEKVPVSLKHGSFVKGFEGIIYSYGAPLYGTIDPTPLVAVFFTLLFGIMFGDIGHGLVLLLAGLATSKRGIKTLRKFKSYSTPLIAVGIASMVMGVLNGAVFTSEELLVGPTRLISGAITGHPVDRILHIMPLAEKGGSVKKLFYFFGFTIGIGIILNSIGLIINIVNRIITKKYEVVFFSKTGFPGLFMFWYAISIAVRILIGGSFRGIDAVFLAIPVFFIFFGPVLWRLISGEKPVLEHGFMTFFMEAFVEILETASTYVSNTVSFLRVGAFALSHAVLSYIVFRFSEELATSGGVVLSISALIVMIFGNVIIIVLEGMIVAIQVVRLQYYEFFNKFFTDTGTVFLPFRFNKN